MRAQGDIERIIRERVRAHPDAVWLKFRDERYTWAQFLSNAQRAANGLLRAGVRPGERVGIMAGNKPDFIWAYFGIILIGAGFVPLNKWQRGPALAHMVSDSDTRTIIHDEDVREPLNELRPACPGFTRAIVFGQAAPGELAFADLMTAPDTEPDVEVATPSKVVDIIYTSGTTGTPKGIYANTFESHLGPIREGLRMQPGETYYTCMPLFHGSGLYIGVNASIRLDACLALGEKFSASGFWDECRRHGAVATQLFSSMFPILLKQPPRADDADNPVRRIFSIGCPPGIWREFEQRFGVSIMESYSMSDAVGMTVNNDGRVGSAGPGAGGSEFRIVDENDMPLPPETLGEILFRHPAGQATRYHNLPEATAHAYRGGWFHTGDLGKMDADGHLYFCGRLKEAIRRRAENISAWEVASVIDMHPKVQESAVFGVPSELGEEEVMAAIVPVPGETLRPEEVMDFCQGRLAYYAMPRFVDVVDELPKTSTQKVQHLALKARGPGPSTWDREKAGYVVKR
ncbi:AMP-binding protein [Ramlibacter sp.]|uniref:AMP-binding protein n=1 Tax=Ramlibacter sp. TaxID=1917967 RepID=UPI003D0A7723